METEVFTSENIKLCKMSKGYQWEIKLKPIPCSDGERIGDTDIDRLKIINDRMKMEFGNLE